MKMLAVLVFACVVLSVISTFIRPRKATFKDLQSQPIMTPNEAEFFWRLEEALPEFHVFPQVAFSALIAIRHDVNSSGRNSLFNRFSKKRADFVICEKHSLEVSAIVELDDKTHSAKADQLRDSITEAAGYRTIRYHSRRKPSESQIRLDVVGSSERMTFPMMTLTSTKENQTEPREGEGEATQF